MLDMFIDSGISLKYIILYYILYLPYIIILTLPVSMLLATMFSMGRLVSDNEITAIKASGISLYRILFPLYGFVLLICLVTMIFSEEIVPRTNLYREDIKDLTKRRDIDEMPEISFTLSKTRMKDRQNLYLANPDNRIIHALSYRSNSQLAQKVVILEPFEFGTDEIYTGSGFKSRLDADSLVFRDGMWYLYNVSERTFEKDGEVFTFHDVIEASFIKLQPADFARIDQKPEEMNYAELSKYIEQVRKKGGDASEWLVDLYLKIAFPFVSLVIVFFGAPMAAGSSLRGKTASFGIALVICFIFYTMINAFQIFGRNGVLDPKVAAWLANGIYAVFGLLMHIRASK